MVKDFIFAALPWIAIGLTVAFLSYSNSKGTLNNDDMCIGMCFGIAISSVFVNTYGVVVLTYGICLGALIGTTSIKLERNQK